jgi:hypothetical protein
MTRQLTMVDSDGGSGTSDANEAQARNDGSGDRKDAAGAYTINDTYDNTDSTPVLRPLPANTKVEGKSVEKKLEAGREVYSVTVKVGVFMPGMRVDAKTGKLTNELSLSELKIGKELIQLAKKINEARKIGPYADVGVETSDGKLKGVDFSLGIGVSVLAKAYVKIKVPFDRNDGASTRLMLGISAAETVEAEADVAEAIDRSAKAMNETTAVAYERLYDALGVPALFIDPKKPLISDY